MANPPSSLILLGFLVLSFSLVLAVDQSTLQDFCVVDPNGQVLVNGLVCKDPKLVEAQDFFFSGLRIAGNTSNQVESKLTPVFAAKLLGLNTLGISMARIDYAPWGINPPHTHTRAAEILTVLEGQLEVGFVTSNPENRFIRKCCRRETCVMNPKYNDALQGPMEEMSPHSGNGFRRKSLRTKRKTWKLRELEGPI